MNQTVTAKDIPHLGDVKIKEMGAVSYLKAIKGVSKVYADHGIKDDEFSKADSVTQQIVEVYCRAHFIMQSVVDENGKRKYGEDDIEEIADWQPETIHKLFDEVQKLNKLGEHAEVSSKNSEASQG